MIIPLIFIGCMSIILLNNAQGVNGVPEKSQKNVEEVEEPKLLKTLTFNKDEFSSTWMGEPKMKCIGGSARSLADNIESIECNKYVYENATEIWECQSIWLPPKTEIGKCVVNCDGSACILRYYLNSEESKDDEKTKSERLEELFAELNKLTGLTRIKTQVRQIANLISMMQIRIEHGLPVLIGNQHLVFVGNPGTGKTMVARLISQIYHELGLLSKGHMIETDRSKLVVGYIGHTANNTRDILEQAKGGVLLIDEAYALSVEDSYRDFGDEAITTIVKYMEDFRDDLVIIFTGYTDEMMKFLDNNPGLRSRIGKIISFPDYTESELLEIFISMSRVYHYETSSEGLQRIEEWARSSLEDAELQDRTRYFGNAREIRNLFERAVSAQASRLMLRDTYTKEDLTTFTLGDIEMAINSLHLD